MRRRFFALLALSVAACGSTSETPTDRIDDDAATPDAGTTSNGAQTPSTSDEGDAGTTPASVLGDDYLFFYEEGGPARGRTEPVCGSPLTFGTWPALLAPTRLDVTTSWPSSLARYRVIVLGGIGATTAGKGLSTSQRDDLVTWVKRGGTLLLVSDYDYSEEQKRVNVTLNTLLASMDVRITILGAIQARSSYQLTLDAAQPLGKDVATLGCGASTKVTFTAPAVAVDAMVADGKAVIATQAVERGRVVVLADQTCLSDNTKAVGTPPLYEDCAVASSARESAGAFLKNLGARSR